MKIYIPTIQEKKEEKNQTISNNQDLTQKYITTSSSTSETDGDKANTKNSENVKESKININTASQEQLETLPGIGPTTATKIIDYRDNKGKFKKIEDIKEVSGIGESKFEKIKEHITVK